MKKENVNCVHVFKKIKTKYKERAEIGEEFFAIPTWVCIQCGKKVKAS